MLTNRIVFADLNANLMYKNYTSSIAVKNIYKAWNDIKVTTIANCFKPLYNHIRNQTSKVERHELEKIDELTKKIKNLVVSVDPIPAEEYLEIESIPGKDVLSLTEMVYNKLEKEFENNNTESQHLKKKEINKLIKSIKETKDIIYKIVP
ncbi:hypothetical protein BB559_003000 [Furculomyces boomerangus]|uniref:Uncharacterized protein n=1 Tax=Furculomyces boomerangus TaxID=61424 RepID=A0A2T9YQA1_9FUNG|nr:hypothetical protein BB559_003000 [Furculomyces boomerangus]